MSLLCWFDHFLDPGQKFVKFFVGFLENLKTSRRHSEIIWPLRTYCSIVYTVPDWSFLCISVTQQGSSLQISFSISRRVLFLFNEKKSIRIQSLDFLYTLHQKSLICSRKNQRNSLKHNAKHCLLKLMNKL